MNYHAETYEEAIGLEVASVREVPMHAKWCYRGAALYRAVPRKADGVLTFRFVKPLARDRRSPDKAIRDAEASGYPVDTSVHHGTPVRIRDMMIEKALRGMV